MKILDLSFYGKLTKEDRIIFNKIATNKIGEFNNFIDDLSKKNINNKYWWYTAIPSRDSLVTPFFFYFIAINFLKHKKKDLATYNHILTDSNAFRKIIINYLKTNDIRLSVKLNSKISLFKSFFSKYITIIKSFFFILSKIIICKLLSKKELLKNKITLIDIYKFDDYYQKDRYYGNIYRDLKKNDAKNIYFVPTIISLKINKIFNIYNYLIKSSEKYLFKENYLKFFDLFEIIKFHLNYKKVNFNLNYSEFNLKELLTEINDKDAKYYFVYETILTYIFIKNLNKNKVDIKCSIDWFENQIIDKAWNLGFNKYYPNIIIKGYRGLIPPNLYISQMYPTEFERQSKVLPKKIIVIGKGFVKEAGKYLDTNIIQTGPALRFRSLFTRQMNIKTDFYKILVILPSSYIISDVIISELRKIKFPQKSRVYIRYHPFTKQDVKLNNNFKKSETEFSKELVDTNLIICNFTSAALEALAQNIDLIFFNPLSNLNNISIPSAVSKKFYKISYDNIDLQKNIIHFYNLKNKNLNKDSDNKIIDEYFIKPNKYNIAELLEIEQ